MQRAITWWKNQNIVMKVLALLVVLGVSCCVCSVPIAIIAPDRTPTPHAVTQAAVETNPETEPSVEDTPVPEATPVPTNTPVPELSFADIVQHPDEKGWTTTQYTTYFDTIKDQQITGWSGTILEVKEFAGEPYVSLDMEPGEPQIDVYVYITEDDILNVGLGQNVTFAGRIDGNWPEDNGFYALQIKDATLLELGEIPIPTPQPTPTPIPQSTPLPLTESEIPLEVQRYGLEIGEKSQTMAEALQELGQLLQNPEPGNEDWVIKAALQVTLIQLTHQELTEMDVPPEMTEIHAAVLDATGDCNTSMDYLVSGIDNLNTDELQTAQAYMLQCSAKMPKAAELLEAYVAQHQ